MAKVLSDGELIEIKPPIDLIPDEFPRETNEKILVELVCGSEDLEAERLKLCLEDLNYTVNMTDKDQKAIDKKINVSWIDNVIEKIETNEYDGLIMIFAKVIYQGGDMKGIWGRFTAQRCPKLKNKPKIFVFQLKVLRAHARSAATDPTATSLRWHPGYETPSEADLLIVINEGDSANLLGALANAINQYGYREDITSLVNIGTGQHYQPMLISTMTRKFYFKIHEHRGHHFGVFEKQESIKSDLEKLKSLHKEKKSEARSTTVKQSRIVQPLWRY